MRYKEGEDVELAEHADASVITLNVCLGVDFEGGDLLLGEYSTPSALPSPSPEETSAEAPLAEAALHHWTRGGTRASSAGGPSRASRTRPARRPAPQRTSLPCADPD